MTEIANNIVKDHFHEDGKSKNQTGILEILFDSYELPAMILDDELRLLKINPLAKEMFNLDINIGEILQEPFHIIYDVLPKALCEPETYYEYLCVEGLFFRIGVKALKNDSDVYYFITYLPLKNKVQNHIPTELEKKISEEINGVKFKFYCVGQRIELDYKETESILEDVLNCSFQASLLMSYLDKAFHRLYNSFMSNPLVELLPVLLKWSLDDNMTFYTRQEITSYTMDKSGCYILEGRVYDVTSKIKERSSFRILEGKLFDFMEHYNSGLLWVANSDVSGELVGEVRVSSANNRALSLLNVDKKDIIGMPLSSIFPQVDHISHFCLDSNTVSSLITHVYDNDQSKKLYNVYIYPFSEFSMWGISFYEVCEVDEMEMPSTTTVDLNISDDIPDFVVKISNDYTIEFINDSMVKALGATKGELIGQSYQEAILEPLGLKNSILTEAVGSKAIRRKELALTHLGVKYDIDFFAIPNILNNGEVDSALLIGRNISHLMNNIRMLQAENKHLKEVGQLKSQFFANMNHEVRTPLNSVLGFMELIDDEFYSLEQRHSFQQRMKENGDYLLNIIDDILDISAIEVNAINPNYGVVNLSSLLRTVFKSFEYRGLINMDIDFVLDVEDEFIKVYSDDRILRRVLTNILNNAWKFTKEGTIKVSMTTNLKGVSVSVCDTGCGIPEDELPFIFDRFRKFSNNYCKSFGGSGLGLSISQHFMHLIRGDINVTTEVGKGSCFKIFIPNTIVGKG
ncbi:PAS domain-containing protein [Halosquirtibacter xylanolyticus]|uniref:PAS domain-containing sensor histidine kinase n=1 Tax=Halosquirtibacter xylanolyticus TaxID=3374599 RepID=UPI00374869AF|nr:PAS domain-containing protein [Prolixibacteraceae bacterium]